MISILNPQTRQKPLRPGFKQPILIALTSTAITAAAILFSSSAHAQEANERARDWSIIVGGGAIYAPDYEGSDDFDILPFPYIAVGYKDIAYIQGPELGINILRFAPSDNVKITLGPIARYRRDRPEKRNRDLVGLGDIDTAIEVGGAAKFSVGQAWLQMSFTKDVAGGHEGLVGTAEAGYDFDLSERLSASVRGTTTRVDDKYMRAYFGVTQQQSLRSGLPQFSAGQGIKDAGASLSLQYRLGNHWTIAALAGYSRLINDAKNAPLVQRRGKADQWQSGAFLAYRF